MAYKDSEPAPKGDDSDRGDVDALLRAVAYAPRAATTRLAQAALVEGAGESLPEALAQAFPASDAGPGAPSPGDIIAGRYRIDAPLGVGGMGIVFRATHLSTGRRVALKWMLLGTGFRSPEDREAAFQRFLREARAAGRIKHPNVVDVYDADQDPRAPFLVMECLEGETLRTRIDRGGIDWEEALALLLPAMRGVAEAHRCGVVHRDLKPDNVFLARDGERVTPKVLDFGISRLGCNTAEREITQQPSLTRTGTIVGTPAYMPLEQLRASGDVDARTDVYALGVVLYEMLCQKRPFEARNAADFAALIACERPVPPSRYRPELRGPREQAMLRALAREPGDRFASIDAFMAALETAPRRRSQALKMAALVALSAVAAASYLTLARPANQGTTEHAAPLPSHAISESSATRTATNSASTGPFETTADATPDDPSASISPAHSTSPQANSPLPERAAKPHRSRTAAPAAMEPGASEALLTAPSATGAKRLPTSMRAEDFLLTPLHTAPDVQRPPTPNPPPARAMALGPEHF